MSSQLRQVQRERGSALALAMLILFILSAIMLFVSTSQLSSMFQTKRKTERATGMAAADSAVERIRYALNNNMMDESDGFSLNEEELKTLISDREDAAVLPNSQSSDQWGMSKVLVPITEAFTVREKADRGYQYWQIVSVHEPRYHSQLPSSLTVYIRAWATQHGNIDEGGTNITTQPRLFRVEFRPGYFSDFQAIFDGPFFTQPSNPVWTLNGPIHTNGFEGDEWITEGKTGYDLRARANCTGKRVRLTASQDAPVKNVGNCEGVVGSRKARQINLLNVDKQLAYMRERCNVPHGVRCFFEGHQSYDIRLTNAGIEVRRGGTSLFGFIGIGGTTDVVPLEPNVRCATTPTDCGDEMMAAVLVDGDINLSGTVTGGTKAARVTVATMRQNPTDLPTRVWIEPNRGTVGAQNTNVDTVGVISQGDIVMGIRPRECGSAINIAGIAQSGSVTMPRELVTLAAPNVPNMRDYVCPNMELTGAFAMHGSFISNMSWNQMGMGLLNAGYQRMGFTYQDTLYDNPPPFFARAYPWAMTKVKDADKRCLEGEAAKDPRCE